VAAVVSFTWAQQFLAEFPWALAAFGLATALAGWQSHAPGDAREWAGRGFGLLVVAAGVLLRCLQAGGH
jgi:hypothetical protein